MARRDGRVARGGGGDDVDMDVDGNNVNNNVKTLL